MTGEMTIENVINRSCINLHMKGRDKKEVIEEMAEMFDRAGVLVESYSVGAYFYQLKPIWEESFFRLMDAALGSTQYIPGQEQSFATVASISTLMCKLLRIKSRATGFGLQST